MVLCIGRVKAPNTEAPQYTKNGKPLTTERRSSQACVQFSEEIEAALDEFMVIIDIFSLYGIMFDGTSQLSIGNSGEVDANRRQTASISLEGG